MREEEPRDLEMVRLAVKDFWSHLAAHVPEMRLVQITDKTWTPDQDRKNSKESGWPKCWGVYVYFSADGTLIYVGLALGKDERPMDKECWNAKKCNEEFEQERRWLFAFVFDRMSEWGFFVKSLETFLISRFKPKYNKNDSHLPLPCIK